MIKERIIQSLGIWLILSFFLLLLGITRWDLPPITAVLYAGLLGLSVFIKLGSQMGGGSDTVDEIISPDRMIIGTVEAWSDNKSIWYIAKVKRNYQDGVFAREKEFESIEEAKQWLAITYQQELEKHRERIKEQETTNH